ncbi:Coq4 family protein [Acaryochloris marina]|uniref:Coenzyme Q (Ubiquinone) biosynthesis protein Coq4 n=1 Tax=Acaryochloris marina (strain MBIC 11017) TaxID=329726 RepID=B0C7I9_ACAM1|nr:Coq4 family protein [Acaryochloris marina]ABW25249.1 hypothetical protein AM1_0163 [Acaryochloris marina MBIC11017]BDM80210.1 hypothetical protein AM10699_30780 [Acaryochloris marina MBIC10699]
MGFKYINEIATPDNINQLLTFIDHVAGAGTDVNEVFDISDLLRDSPQMERCLTWMREDAATAQMIEAQYLGSEYDLEKMLQMPEGSLGWTYARVMSALGYEPHFYRLRNIEKDADYVINRIRKTHDLHHILTGFSMDDFGEAGVLSVTVAQTGYPGWILINLLGMLLDFFGGPQDNGIDVEYDYDILSTGIKIGRDAKPLFPVKWEERFEQPLDDLRSEFNIQPVTEGQWSWYSRPQLRDAIALTEPTAV